MKGAEPSRFATPKAADTAMAWVLVQPTVVKIITADNSRSPHPPTEMGTTMASNIKGTAVTALQPMGTPSATAQQANDASSAATNQAASRSSCEFRSRKVKKPSAVPRAWC